MSCLMLMFLVCGDASFVLLVLYSPAGLVLQLREDLSIAVGLRLDCLDRCRAASFVWIALVFCCFVFMCKIVFYTYMALFPVATFGSFLGFL